MDNRRRIGLRGELLILGMLCVLPFVALLAARDHEARAFSRHNAEETAKHITWIALTGQTLQIKSAQQILTALSVVPEIWNADDCNKLMGELIAQNPRYANFGLIAPNGDILCSGVPFTPPINVADRLYFKKAIETKTFAMGEYQIGRITGVPTVNFGFPVYAKNGDLRGVLIGALNLLWMNRVLEGITLPPDTESFIVDRNGTVLAHHPNPDAWIGKTFTGSPVVNHIFSNGKEDTVEAQGLDGITRLFSYAPLPTVFGGGETYVVIGLSSAVVAADSNRILQRDILIVAIMAAMMLIFGWIAGEQILLRRLQVLVDASKRFASGRFSTMIPPMVHDEIGQLASSFNEMASQLKELYKNLEGKVREKTKEIESERELLETLLENLPVAAIVVDAPSGSLRIINRMGKQLLGYKKGKRILNECLFVNEAGIRIPENELPLSDTLNKGKTFINHTGLFLKKENLAPIALRTSGAIVRGEGPEGDSAIFIMEDTTKELAIDRAKSEFVSLASHQLRTPLTATNWFCELLLEGSGGKLTKKQLELLTQLHESNSRMVALVNSLLNVSRIEAGKFSIEPTKIDLPEFVDGLLSEYRQRIERKNLLVETDYDAVDGYRGDPKLVRVILENFLLNAINYTPGNGKIAITLAKTETEIHIEVKDTGYGIPRNEQDKIFSKLFRGSNIRNVDTEGSGLGLYLVKTLVEQVGGRVWFESTEKKGSTFSAALPIEGMTQRKGTAEMI
ncbi:MAG: ATP-binding protein [Patescibacteria group bacterium]|mgnify:FL=1